ncbi:MAG: hypothetical protein ACT4PM_14790, partial [Gemmatimonadales bacterium]
MSQSRAFYALTAARGDLRCEQRGLKEAIERAQHRKSEAENRWRRLLELRRAQSAPRSEGAPSNPGDDGGRDDRQTDPEAPSPGAGKVVDQHMSPADRAIAERLLAAAALTRPEAVTVSAPSAVEEVLGQGIPDPDRAVAMRVLRSYALACG